VTVQLGQTEQTIEGFGINDNWATQFSSAQADALFTTTSGIGLSILRTGMNPSGAFYNGTAETSGNIAAVKSRAGSSAKIIGSVWSPPATCKTNDSINDGGHLMTSCYDSWSTTIANFASSNGFYAMSIGNEPDFASCGTADPCNGNYDTTLFTATETVAWVKVAGPKLQAKGVKVIAPEASEWIHTWSNVSAGPDVGGKESSDPLKCGCFPDKNTASCAATCTSGGGYDYGHYLANDATAWAAFDILGVHEYDSQAAIAWPSDVNGGKPNKEVWQTEMSGVKWWPEQGPSSDINNGVVVAGWIHSALVDGQASAWLWWWYQATGTDDNEGLYLKSGADTKRHYTLGNYSKFVRPGYLRVDVTGSVPAGVLLSAYKGSDGTVVIVAINKNASAVNVPISIAGGTAPASLTPNVTSSSANLTSGTAVTLSGGSFTAALAATTVTTFVGK
jgi:glucuronoarabinoxylan endo-1,4-beta-xylanase